MSSAQSRSNRPFQHARVGGQSGLEFDPLVTEVSILDRSGRAIWSMNKGEEPTPIRWNGISSSGQTVETGDYVCKIVYPDAKVAYLPFVFMKKN